MQEPAHQALAAPVAIDVGRIEESHPGVGGGVQGGHGLVLAHVAPVTAELPASQADNAYAVAGLA